MPTSIIATIKNRKAILLDTCIWIAIAEGKASEATQLRKILFKLEDAKLIFCPLSAPTIWELYKQAEPSISRTAEIMERLSLNISFKDISNIYDAEVAHFMDFLERDRFIPLKKTEIFGSWQSYLCNRFSIEPNPKATYVIDQKMYEQLSEAVRNLRLSEYIKMAGGRSFSETKRKPRYQKVSIERRQVCGADKKKAQRVEQENMASKMLIPRFNRAINIMPLEKQAFIKKKLDGLPKDQKYKSPIEYSLNFLPAFAAYVEMCTVTGYDDNRKDSMNDFFDRELMLYGMSYASYFASTDSWINSMIKISRKNGFPGTLGFMGSIKELTEQLENIQ